MIVIYIIELYYICIIVVFYQNISVIYNIYILVFLICNVAIFYCNIHIIHVSYDLLMKYVYIYIF